MYVQNMGINKILITLSRKRNKKQILSELNNLNKKMTKLQLKLK